MNFWEGFVVVWDNLPYFLIGSFPNDEEPLWGIGGLALSIILAAGGIVCSFGLGLVAGLMRTSRRWFVRLPAIIYVELIRGTPLIMVIFWFYFFLPILIGAHPGPLLSALIAFTMFTGAYLAEVVRAGVLAIPVGQREAALSTGLSYTQMMVSVVLPQALRSMVPSFANQFISLFKDTSLAYVIGVIELTQAADIVNKREIHYSFQIFICVGILYFIFSFAMSRVSIRLEVPAEQRAH